MNYYGNKKKCYQNRYRKNKRWGNGIPDVLRLSGFSSYPMHEYSVILATIHSFSGKFDSIYDMGCGSGLLLNCIDTHLGYPVNLYGVDFVEESILLAHSYFPKYHFFCKNVVDYKLSKKISENCLILINPYHYLSDDLLKLIQYYFQLDAKVIVYTYSDILSGLCYKNIFAFELFDKYTPSFSIIEESINTAILGDCKKV